MTVQRTDNEFIIKIPTTIGVQEMQDLLDYIAYLVVSSKSTATQEAVDKLAREVNKNWWEKNKDKFLNK
ncbi:MAG: hypothetical protein AAB316_21075 [Bacteroidota bacterium]